MVNKIIKFNIAIIFFCLGYLIYIDNVTAKNTSELLNKIAFLKKGEVWISDIQRKELKKVTNTEGKVENFLFSPTLQYIAYSKIIKYVDEPGLWKKGEAPKRPVSSIVIKNLIDGTIIKEIFPSEWIHITKWRSADKLFYHESSGFDVSGFFEYDIRKGNVNRIDYKQGDILSDADHHKDGSLVVYVTNSGVGKKFTSELHLVDTKLNTDTIVVKKRSILDPKISHDKSYIAFFEVEWNFNTSKGRDNVWIYSIKNKSLKKVYTGKSMPKAGGKDELLWSLDNKYLGLFHPKVAIVLYIQRSEHIQTISGTDFQWITNNNIIFSQDGNIYRYSLKANKKKLIYDNAIRPVFLWK
jgi:Tol biopolymer transport system component